MNLHEIGNNFLSFKARIAMIFNKRVHIEGSNYLKNSLDRPPILIIYFTISLRQLFKRENQEPFGHVQVQNNLRHPLYEIFYSKVDKLMMKKYRLMMRFLNYLESTNL